MDPMLDGVWSYTDEDHPSQAAGTCWTRSSARRSVTASAEEASSAIYSKGQMYKPKLSVHFAGVAAVCFAVASLAAFLGHENDRAFYYLGLFIILIIVFLLLLRRRKRDKP